MVKPVVVARRVVRRARRDGADLSARLSPKRGESLDVFDDLVGLARLFPHPNLAIDVLAVEIDEVRVGRRRRPGYAVVDRALREAGRVISPGRGPRPLAAPARRPARSVHDRRPGRAPRPTARVRPAGRLLPATSGAAVAVGKVGNRIVYEPATRSAP